jgi:hypothetical protein
MTNGNSAELLPCPFCGGKAKRSFNEFYRDDSIASCCQCGAAAYWKKWQARAALSVCADGGELRDFQRELANYFEDVGDPHGAMMIRNFADLSRADGGKGEAVQNVMNIPLYATATMADYAQQAECAPREAQPTDAKRMTEIARKWMRPDSESAPEFHWGDFYDCVREIIAAPTPERAQESAGVLTDWANEITDWITNAEFYMVDVPRSALVALRDAILANKEPQP